MVLWIVVVIVLWIIDSGNIFLADKLIGCSIIQQRMVRYYNELTHNPTTHVGSNHALTSLLCSPPVAFTVENFGNIIPFFPHL